MEPNEIASVQTISDLRKWQALAVQPDGWANAECLEPAISMQRSSPCAQGRRGVV